MRIVHIATVVDDEFSLGGPLTVALGQCRALRDAGHDVVLAAGWTGRGDAPSEIEGVPVKLFRAFSVLPPLRFSGLLAPALLIWIFRERRRIDVGHVHFARDLVPLTAAMLLRLCRIPFVTQTHGMVVADPRRVSRVLDRIATVPLLRRASERFVLTERERNDLAVVTGRDLPMSLLPNGVDIPGDERLEPPSPDVLFLARLHPRKRVMAFAGSAADLIAKRAGVRFSVVGPDDGDAPALEAFISARPELDGRLVYEGALGHTEAVARIGRALVYVLPSVDEPFPMTMLEALSLGVPVVATSSNGLAADLVEADAAVIVPDDDPDALAHAIDRVLSEPGLSAGLSTRGRQLVSEKYGMAAVAAQLTAAYRSAISRNAK